MHESVDRDCDRPEATESNGGASDAGSLRLNPFAAQRPVALAGTACETASSAPGVHHSSSPQQESTSSDAAALLYPGVAASDTLLEDSAKSEGPFSSYFLGQSGTLLSSMDLKASMRQRHGWSAPWLPGLWLMPDGSLFGNSDVFSSLLLSLQLFFEKESGIEWQCPVGVVSAEHAWAQHRRTRQLRVSIAERARRERVQYIPGFSEATSRAIPSMAVWQQLAEGMATWERVWTDPHSEDTKKIIQV
jgi:hypothetical protein